jgi:hypothetical protein
MGAPSIPPHGIQSGGAGAVARDPVREASMSDLWYLLLLLALYAITHALIAALARLGASS